jgi:hypothetical protein
MKVRVRIDESIAALKKNLSDHVVELTEAIEVWTEDLHKAMTEFGAAVNRDGLKASHEKLYRLMYQRPADNRLEYAKYIGMLERTKSSGEAFVAIDEDEYDRVFNDNWEWRSASRTTNAIYKKS